MDDRTSKARSNNMSRIRGKDTKPEEIVRKYLYSKWFRYRKNDKRLPGHPDIVLPKYRAVMFVNGCFWHMHDCKMFVMPKSRIEYWEPKLKRNKQRDEEVKNELETMAGELLLYGSVN